MRTRQVALALAVGMAGVPVALGGAVSEPASIPDPSYGSYAWPVHGPVMRRFEPPSGPFGPGHRGIDIGAEAGVPVRASEDGVVAFAGRVAGDLHVSIDHPDGVRTSYAFLSTIEVRAGDPVARGQVIGAVGPGHSEVGAPHLHFGARYAGQYFDPLLLLERRSLVGLIHLAPIEEPEEDDTGG